MVSGLSVSSVLDRLDYLSSGEESEYEVCSYLPGVQDYPTDDVAGRGAEREEEASQESPVPSPV